ncbi:MAG: peptidoglycan DD-metalloendopeptidase family protein [Rhodobacteraceae bacterium]|nr:peptidoglycan DD-metalloendopeptidase family protein [Paracoccaceae bacterium]
MHRDDNKGVGLLKSLANKLNHVLNRVFPEQRIFLRSEEGTRFLRLSSIGQMAAWTGSAAFVGWAIIATAILLMGAIGSGNIRDQAEREQRLYEERLQVLAAERDIRTSEALAAQERFNLALAQVSVMQSALLSSEDRLKELETGIGVIQSTLRRAMNERDDARTSLEAMLAAAQTDEVAKPSSLADSGEVNETLGFLTSALEATAAERDLMEASALEAEDFAQNMIYEQRLRDERNDQIFQQLEDAVSISLEPLDKLFRASGMSTEQILDQIRLGYSGQGGAMAPLVVSTMSGDLDPDAMRANAILNQLDRMNLYRIAAQKIPFGNPVRAAYRFTSGYGMRWGRLHKGADFAAPVGTPIYATADGVVTRAAWTSGYGRMITIQHEFGIETRYAHLSAFKVQKGQRVSRGERIGDMGNSGNSTGSHLHYEIRVGGKATNPMTYIKAANNVF